MREIPLVPRLYADGKPRRHMGKSPVCVIGLLRIRMSHRVYSVIRRGHVRYALGGIYRGSPVDNTPIGTYQRGESESGEEIRYKCLNPIGSFCQDVNHELLVLRFPSSCKGRARVGLGTGLVLRQRTP
jgi:hypothetical protein